MSDKIIVQIDRRDAQSLRENGPVAGGPLNRAYQAIIAALPPEEPTKRGAVVEAGGVLHFLADDGLWRTGQGYVRTWKSICEMGTPVVHFEGVDQ